MSDDLSRCNLSDDEFEGLVDVFRTLLEWEKESEHDKGETNGSDNYQSDIGCASEGRLLS